MSTDVLVVGSHLTLGQVARAMRKRNVGSAVVADETGKALGMLSERRLVDSVAASRNPDIGEAASWMDDLATISPHASLAEATVALREGGVRHLLVVDDEESILGIISISDVLSALQRETLAA